MQRHLHVMFSFFVLAGLVAGCTPNNFRFSDAQNSSQNGEGSFDEPPVIPDVPDDPDVVVPPVIPEPPVVVNPPTPPQPPVVVIPPAPPEPPVVVTPPTPPPVEHALTEEFVQDSANSKVDVLFITDNSTSMTEDQKKLGDKFKNFVSGLGDIDWQLGITTTDVEGNYDGARGTLLNLQDRPSLKVINRNTPGAQNSFARTIAQDGNGCDDPPFCGSNVEQPLKAMQLSFEQANQDNRVLYRNNADVAVVVLSDEDEMSTGPDKATKASEVVTAFQRQFGNSKRLIVFGIVIVPKDEKCRDEQSDSIFGKNSYGKRVAELAKLTGGDVMSICAKKYDTHLWNIGSQIADLFDSVELAHKPIAGSVKVKFSPSANIKFSVKDKRLVFDKKPAQGTKITVTYKY